MLPRTATRQSASTCNANIYVIKTRGNRGHFTSPNMRQRKYRLRSLCGGECCPLLPTAAADIVLVASQPAHQPRADPARVDAPWIVDRARMRVHAQCQDI